MNMKKTVFYLAVAFLLGLAWFAARSRAVTTSHWTVSNGAEFKGGAFHNVVTTNLGDLKLSRAVTGVLEQDAHISSVYSLAEASDGTLYAGTGPEARLLAIKGDKVVSTVNIDQAVNILSLLAEPNGALLVGTGGDKGRILRIDGPGQAPHEIFSADGVQYVYAMCRAGDGTVYAATGPTGTLFRIKPDGSHDVLYKSTEDNLLSMTFDGKDTLYVGTHPHGLVIRVDRTTGKPFVLYDASETEITALALDGGGALYAATGDASPHGSPGGSDTSPGGKPNAGHPDAPATQPITPTSTPPTTAPADKAQASVAQPAIVFPRLMDDAPDQGPPGDADQGPPPDSSGPQPPGGTDSSGPANAVYKIDKDGFVTDVFHGPVVIYCMAVKDGQILIGTGGDGLIEQIDPVAQETSAVGKVESKQVTSLLVSGDGRVWLGLANAGAVSVMTQGFADKGTYVSTALDATQVSRFGVIHMHGHAEKPADLTVSTRSGNTHDPDSGGWSDWADEQPADEYITVKSPSARYLQYRFTLTSSDGKQSPVVNSVDIAYQTPNMAPVISAVKVEPSPLNQQLQVPAQGGPPRDGDGGQRPPKPDPNHPTPTPIQQITFDASDPNNDTLEFALYIRQLKGADRGPWVLIKDKLHDSQYDLDTRTIADGRYELKVVASDAPSNTPGEEKTTSRISDPFVVNNTAPAIGNVKWRQNGPQISIDFDVADATSPIGVVDFSVDSHDDWRAVLPSDSIWDQPHQSATATIPGLSPGDHQVTLRAADDHGNTAYSSIVVHVDANK
jgi:hypothetical protein